MRPPVEGDEHDPPGRGPDLRQDGLRDGDLAEQVDLELAPEVRDGDGLDGAEHADPGVVHDGVEALGQDIDERGDVRCVGDVEPDGCDARVLHYESLAAGAVADAGEDRPVGACQSERDRLADPSPGSGDECCRHGPAPSRACQRYYARSGLMSLPL